jgi:RsiW-degrading membrane proteinase PrsW (M82 family)
VPYFLRRHPLLALVAVVLLLSWAAGYAADSFTARHKSLVQRAHELELSGRPDQAEKLYLDLAAQRPGDVLLLVDLLDNHDRLVRVTGAQEHASPAKKQLGLDPPVLLAAAEEDRIDALLASPALSADAALLVRWWRHVLLDADDAGEGAAIVAAAHREPPAPWANHLLARHAAREGQDAEAADLFAREASAFRDRRADAADACGIWAALGDWDRIAAALADATFGSQTPATVHMDVAIHERDWASAVRWFIPSQYERTTTGIWLLAGLSGLGWFAFCAVVGRVRERPTIRVPLYCAAFALGVASTYVTFALYVLELTVLNFAPTGHPAADAIYFVFGVGLREELSKALLFLPLMPILKRFGTRRDALACGALVGLGFAAEENLGYLQQSGLQTALARFLTANFLHLSTTGIVAVALDDAARSREDEATSWSQTIPLVVLTHGMYDFFLSSDVFGGQSFLAMFCFVLLARRFVNVIRQLPGREGPLLAFFVVGLAVVAGGTFVYASTLVGTGEAANAIAVGALGLAIVAYMFGREFSNV